MRKTSGASRVVLVLLAFCAILGSHVFVGTTTAQAGTLNTRTFNLNVCDQQGNGDAELACRGNSPDYRAARIADSIRSGDSNVVMFQEICLTTFNAIVNNLGNGGWKGFHLSTRTVSSTRCSFAGSAGDPTYWGIAVLVRGAGPYDVGWARLTGLAPPAEQRYLLCATFAITASFRVCSSHLGFQANQSIPQFAEVAYQINDYANSGGAITLGMDANLNGRDCDAAQQTRSMYIGAFGGASNTSTCQVGTGTMYEADQHHNGGDGNYNAVTFESQGWTIDYIFMNYQKWTATYNLTVSNTLISDHRILRATSTLYW